MGLVEELVITITKNIHFHQMKEEIKEMKTYSGQFYIYIYIYIIRRTKASNN